jgi:hypothetical protein
MTWPSDAGAGGIGGLDVAEDALPGFRALLALEEGDGHRSAGAGSQAPQHGELGVDVLEVGNDLEPAAAEGGRDVGELGLLGAQRGRVAAVERLVGEGARGGEAERAGADALGGERGPFRRGPRPWRARRLAPRSPMTWTRSAACGTWAATSTL